MNNHYLSMFMSPVTWTKLVSLRQSLCPCCLLTTWKWCTSSGSVMGRTNSPPTHTQYFALRMLLPPALQVPFSFHLGCGYYSENVNLSLSSKFRPTHQVSTRLN